MKVLLRLLILLTVLCMVPASLPGWGVLAETGGWEEDAAPEAYDDADDDADDGDGDGVVSATAEDEDEEFWADALEAAESTGEAAEGLEVYFLDLGRVDGILIRCDGVCSFIDVGFKKDAKPAIQYLKYLGVDHIDSYIASHAHDDHVGGAARIIGEFHPGTLYINRKECMNAIRANVENSAQKKAINDAKSVVVKPGDTFNIGSAVMKCLGPQKIQSCSTGAYDENYNSLILRMDYKDLSFLFTGDTHDEYLRSANKHFPGEIDVDVFKNPHHNGKHSEDVVKLIKPKLTVFCTSNERKPNRKYQALLRSYGSDVLITGTESDGNIAIIYRDGEVDYRVGYPMTSVALKPVPVLYPGEEYTLKGTIEPKDYAKVRWLRWKSSDPNVVSVSGNRVKAVGEGDATVTATSLNGVSASVEVQVRTTLVRIEETEITVAVGEEHKLKARVYPKKITGVTGEWVSADPSIAVVTAQGEVIGAREGTTQVFARLSNGMEAVCNVTVSGLPVEAVKLSERKATMKVGDFLKLTASVEPSFLNDVQLEWASSNEKVLWVDDDGNITAVGKGTAKVGVRAPNGKFDVCTIKVE